MGKRERSRRRRLIRLRVALVVTLVAGAAYGGYVLTGTRLFALTAIDVVGATSRDAVVDASGLRLGQNVMKIDFGAIEERIAQLPNVAGVRIQRIDALRLRITVQERVAALRVESGEHVWFVDENGSTVSMADEPPVPVLRIPLAFEGAAASSSVDAALAVWRALPPGTRARVGELTTVDGGIAFDLDGTQVLFGDARNARRKLIALSAVRSQLRDTDREARWIDVRVPDHPAARLK